MSVRCFFFFLKLQMNKRTDTGKSMIAPTSPSAAGDDQEAAWSKRMLRHKQEEYSEQEAFELLQLPPDLISSMSGSAARVFTLLPQLSADVVLKILFML